MRRSDRRPCLAAVVLAWTFGGLAVSANSASACSIISPKSEAEQLQADLAEQAGAWEGSFLVYLGVVVGGVPPTLSDETVAGPPVLRPGAQQRSVRVRAERVLKGRLPDEALIFDFLVDVHCVPSDIASSRPGDRLIIYAGESGPDNRSGAIRQDRIRDPVTVSALTEIVDVTSGDLNRDGTTDTALLSWPPGASLAGFEIHLREPQGDLRRTLAIPDYAWGARGGGTAGSRPSLSLTDDGDLLVHEQSQAGTDRFEQVRTIEWRDDHFVLSRFERINWTLGQGVTDRCSVDLAGGRAVWNDRASRFPPMSPAVEQTTAWSSCEEFMGEFTDDRRPVPPPADPPANE